MSLLPAPSLLRLRKSLALTGAALALAAAFAAAPVLADEQELPTPEEIIARYVEALGGEELLRAGTSSTAKGTFEMPAMGVSGEITMFQMAPDKSFFRITVPGMGEIAQGYDGTIGWVDEPMQGARLLEGEMLKEAARDARFHEALEYDELYPQQTTAGQAEWNGQPAWQLDLVDTDGNESSRYFAKDTGLLLGEAKTTTTEMGTMELTVKLGEYKDFGGALIATAISLDTMGMEQIITLESVTFDDVDPGVFEPSDAIKALLAE